LHCCAVLGLSKHRIIECKNLAFNPESGCQIIISGDYCPVIFVVTSLHLVVGSWIIMSVILKWITRARLLILLVQNGSGFFQTSDLRSQTSVFSIAPACLTGICSM
jgi:hypothetical protein